MNRRKPKIGDRVFWQSEDGPKEYGKIVEVHGNGIVEVRWDTPPEYYEPEDTFAYDLTPACSVKLCEARQ